MEAGKQRASCLHCSSDFPIHVRIIQKKRKLQFNLLEVKSTKRVFLGFVFERYLLQTSVHWAPRD